jgi:hypothetical protein
MVELFRGDVWCVSRIIVPCVPQSIQLAPPTPYTASKCVAPPTCIQVVWGGGVEPMQTKEQTLQGGANADEGTDTTVLIPSLCCVHCCKFLFRVHAVAVIQYI